MNIIKLKIHVELYLFNDFIIQIIFKFKLLEFLTSCHFRHISKPLDKPPESS